MISLIEKSPVAKELLDFDISWTGHCCSCNRNLCLCKRTMVSCLVTSPSLHQNSHLPGAVVEGRWAVTKVCSRLFAQGSQCYLAGNWGSRHLWRVRSTSPKSRLSQNQHQTKSTQPSKPLSKRVILGQSIF